MTFVLVPVYAPAVFEHFRRVAPHAESSGHRVDAAARNNTRPGKGWRA